MRAKLRALYKRIPPDTLRYIIAGIGSTLVDLGSFALLTLFGMADDPANAVSIALAVLFAYVVNKLYVFRSHVESPGALIAEFFKFVLGRAATALLEYWGYPLLLSLLGGYKLVAKGLTIVVIFALNYVLSKLLVFRRPSSGES